MKLSKVLILLGGVHCLCHSSNSATRGYHFYLQPENAEQTLSQLHFRGPIPAERWHSLLGSKQSETYSVQPGDSLWTISKRSLGDPKLWAKLWQVNPQLTNPHELNVGQLLAFNRSDRVPASNEIPLVHLVPNKPGAMKDLDSDSIVNLELRNQFRPKVFVMEESDFLGEVSGSYSSKTWLGEGELLYLKLTANQEVPPSTRFSIVRHEREISDSYGSGHRTLGQLVSLVAEVEVVPQADASAMPQAEIKKLFGVLKRGDKVIAVREPVKPPAVFNPPDAMEAHIVMGRFEEAKFLGQGEIVVLNKGVADGVKAGFLFRVVETLDPVLDSTRAVSPDYKGEIQVVSVGKFSSVGLILRNRMPLVAGDTLVAAQKFADRPQLPRPNVKEIELN